MTKHSAWIPLAVCAAFFVAGCAFVVEPGIHTDAALEVDAFYSCGSPVYRVRVFHTQVPLMVMSYLGALKSWLYLPIFSIWDSSPVTLRAPMLLVGSVTIWLFHLFLERISGRRAALAGC